MQEDIETINTRPVEMLLFHGLEPSAGNQTGDNMLAEMWKVRTELKLSSAEFRYTIYLNVAMELISIF